MDVTLHRLCHLKGVEDALPSHHVSHQADSCSPAAGSGWLLAQWFRDMLGDKTQLGFHARQDAMGVVDAVAYSLHLRVH